jgi:hypothetical protein
LKGSIISRESLQVKGGKDKMVMEVGTTAEVSRRGREKQRKKTSPI